MRRWFFALIAALFVALAQASFAVEPDEVLDDPALESRARALSAELRCLVCQNQSIDDSNAALARELRLLLRERLVAGDSDAEILDYLVGRYGDFVLLRPRFNASTAVLWAAPILLLLAGGILAFRVIGSGSRKQTAGSADLSEEEERKLRSLIKSPSGTE